MEFLQDLWEDYALIGVALILLIIFFIFRLFQFLFRRARLRREGTVGQIFAQVVIAGILSAFALIACWPELVGLRREELGMKPRKAQIAETLFHSGRSSTSSTTLPAGVSWQGTLAPAKSAIQKKDLRALAAAVFDCVKKEPARSREVHVLVTQFALGPDFIALGADALAHGDVERALDLLDLGTDLAPTEADGFYYRALARLKKKQPDLIGALADLEAAVRKAKPGDLRAVEKRLELRLAQKPPDLRGALEDLDRLVAARPHDAALLATRARRRVEVGLLDGGIADLVSASRALPKDTELRFELVSARLKLGQPAASEVALKEAEDLVKLVPKDARSYFFRGVAQFQLRHADIAVADFSHALQIDPNMTDAYYYRGRARFDQDQQSTLAKPDLDQAIKLDPNHRGAYYWRGVLQRDRDPRKSIEDLTRAIELGADPWAYFYRGEQLLHLGRKDDADRSFADALANALDQTTQRQIDEAVRRARSHARPSR